MPVPTNGSITVTPSAPIPRPNSARHTASTLRSTKSTSGSGVYTIPSRSTTSGMAALKKPSYTCRSRSSFSSDDASDKPAVIRS